MPFRKATKKDAKLRLALAGPSGSGKTYTALSIATAMMGNPPTGRIAVLDSESGSAAKFSDLFDFDVDDTLTSYAPRDVAEAIAEAEKSGFGILIIDSLSAEYEGAGGLLEMVDKQAARSQSNNSFQAWGSVTPQHRKLMKRIIASKLHVIATMRVKTEYVIEQDERTKKMQPRKIGLAPIQKAGTEYEFDIVGNLDMAHNLIIDNTRCPAMDGEVYPKAGADVAAILMEWLTAEPLAAADPPAETPSEEDRPPSEPAPEPESRRVQPEGESEGAEAKPEARRVQPDAEAKPPATQSENGNGQGGLDLQVCSKCVQNITEESLKGKHYTSIQIAAATLAAFGKPHCPKCVATSFKNGYSRLLGALERVAQGDTPKNGRSRARWNPLVCTRCNDDIVDTNVGGASFTKEQISGITTQEYKKPLCHPCYEKVRDGESEELETETAGTAELPIF